MGKKRFIDSDFWVDSWVVENLDPLDCHLFMYLLTNPRANISGVYELSFKIMSFQVGIEKDKLPNMLKRLEPKVFYKNGWVVLANGIRNQNYKNSKIVEGIRRELCAAPADLLELLKLPSDLDIDLSCPVDESYMSHTRLITPNLTKPNLTKPNLTANAAAAKPQGFKKNYALAAQADRDLEKRVAGSHDRKSTTIKKTASMKEIFGNGNS